MKEQLKKNWFKIVIAIVLVIGISFFCWEIYNEQKYYSDKHLCIEKCYHSFDDKLKYSEKAEACEKVCSYEFSRIKILDK